MEGTQNPLDDMNPLCYTFRYLTNAGGSWSEKGGIGGSATSGPFVAYTPALAKTRDKKEEQHLHMAYTVWEPTITFFAGYA